MLLIYATHEVGLHFLTVIDRAKEKESKLKSMSSTKVIRFNVEARRIQPQVLMEIVETEEMREME